MNIKKSYYCTNIFFFLFCLLLCLASCKEEEEFLTISVSELNIPAKGEEKSIDIHTNSVWIAEVMPAGNSSWVTLNTMSGNANTSSVHIMFAENNTDQERTAEILFRAGKTAQSLKITQKEKTTLVVSDRGWYIGQPGGRWPFPIDRNVDYTVSISPEARSWLQLSETKAITTDTLYLTVRENLEPEMREGAIYIKATDVSAADTIFVSQEALQITVSTEQLDFAPEGGSGVISINSTHTDHNYNPEYTYVVEPEAASWCQIKKSEDSKFLFVSVSANEAKVRREANINIKSSTLTKTVRVIQQEDGLTYYADGEYVRLQTASAGKGVNIAIMGDGFTKADLVKDGRYENLANQAMEHFFSIEPYKSNRKYFNVYIIFAQSEEAGVNGEIPGITIDNRFGSIYGEGTNINWNDSICDVYLNLVPELKGVVEMTTILFLNSSKYAGTAHLYSNGFCIAACPISKEAPPFDFKGLVHHEAGGHAFGLLADEYIIYEEKASEGVKAEIRLWQKFGCYRNVSSTNDLSQVPWSVFTGKEKYAYVGAYEGAYLYQSGVWRPEEISCMDINIPYYNAPSRWAIVDRIRRLAGEPCTFDDFMQSDHVTPWSATKTKPQKSYPPLGKPVLIKSKTSGRL